MGKHRISNLVLATTLLLSLVVLPVLLTGCAAAEEKGKTSKVSQRPADDRIRTRGDDLIVGHLKADSFVLSSPYFEHLELKRSEVREIEFEGKIDSVTTRHGDVLKGHLATTEYQFQARLGKDVTFQRRDLKRIEFGK